MSKKSENKDSINFKMSITKLEQLAKNSSYQGVDELLEEIKKKLESFSTVEQRVEYLKSLGFEVSAIESETGKTV